METETLLSEIIPGYQKLSIHTKEKLLSFCEQVDLPPKAQLILKNSFLDKLYFVYEGLLREYYIDDSEKITTLFVPEGCFYIPLIHNKTINSTFQLESLESSKIMTLSLAFFNDRTIQDLDVQNLISNLLKIKYKTDLDWKIMSNKKVFKSKWDYFNNLYPGLSIRIPQKHLASFFNITPQYLSQLRSKKKL